MRAVIASSWFRLSGNLPLLKSGIATTLECPFSSMQFRFYSLEEFPCFVIPKI